MTVSCLFLVCLPRYSFTWFQLLASGLLDCGAGFTLSLFILFSLQSSFCCCNCLHGLFICSNNNWQGSERRTAANATAGSRLGRGRGCRLPSNHLVSLQNCDAWCRCQSSVHHGRKVLQHEFVNTFGFVARVDSLCFMCFPQRVR